MKITVCLLFLLFIIHGCSHNDSKRSQRRDNVIINARTKTNSVDISKIRNKLVAISLKDVLGNAVVSYYRVIGFPGDLILFKDGNLYINGIKYLFSESTKFNYRTKFRGDYDQIVKNLGNVSKDYENFYNIFLSYSESIAFEKRYRDNIEMFKKEQLLEYNYKILLNGRNKFGWDLDNFGPIRIPKPGERFNVDSAKIFLYDYKNDASKTGQILISENYFFLLADDFHNVADSRQFGLVSEKQILEVVSDN